MIIVLDDKLKNDLSFLAEVDVEVVAQFCKITLDFIRNSSQSTKIFAGAAKKLGVRTETIESVILALCYLFTEGAKQNTSELDFIDSLLVLGFPSEINDVIKEAFHSGQHDIRTLLSDMAFGLPRYVDLDWRLDVQLASRCMRDQVKPVFVLKLETETNGERKVEQLQTDFTNLRQLQKELEVAADELKTAYARRIARNL